MATVVAAVPGADPADAAAATAAASAELLPTAVGLALLFSVFDCSAGVRLSCGAHFGGGNVRVLFFFFFFRNDKRLTKTAARVRKGQMIKQNEKQKIITSEYNRTGIEEREKETTIL